MKKLVIVLAVLSACSGTWSHNGVMEVRYTGVVAATGGALLVIDPLLNGDHLSTPTTVVGAVLAALGVGAITGSFYLPVEPTTGACQVSR